MQINRLAIALLLTLVSTASTAEVTASKKATRKTRKNNGGNTTPYVFQRFILLLCPYNSYCRFYSTGIPSIFNFHRFFCLFLLFPFIYLLSIANCDEFDFDAAMIRFHSTVNHTTAMVGYTNALSSIHRWRTEVKNGSEYDTVFSIMKALADPDPDEFVGIIRNRFFENKMVGGRHLGAFAWIGNAVTCAATAVGSGFACLSIPVALVDNFAPVDPCESMIDNTKDNC